MKKCSVPITKPYLPPIEKYKKYIDKIYESGWLTNRGPLVQELERRLAEFLGVKHVVLVANGSLALQVAYKALDLEGEVVTTPFSFAATTSTVVWESLKPVFSDIDSGTFNLDPAQLETAITPDTTAILPVHVFGNPCDVESIQSIADKHNLKVIYDAAHAFGVQYNNKSVLKYGDISTLSFHATKLFHTIEGGAILTDEDELAEKARKLINFGITGPEMIEGLGTNAKMNEFEAAMGLCVLDDIDSIIQERRGIYELYKKELHGLVTFQHTVSDTFAYVPVLFEDEAALINIQQALNALNIYPRRYFYPSLDKVWSEVAIGCCPISQDISRRIMCLPIYIGMSELVIDTIRDAIISFDSKRKYSSE